MGAPLLVEVVAIKEVFDHPNADRLDIAVVKGWNCIVGKKSLNVGDLVVYIPPDDSVLPEKLMDIVFSDTKIKAPSNGRIRTIKIRGSISEGLIITLRRLQDFYPELRQSKIKEGSDVKDILGITKYQPKEKSPFTVRNGQQAPKKRVNPNFKKYTNINHLKNYPDSFNDEEMIVITEKIHGSNCRAGYVPVNINGFWNKIVYKFKTIFNKRNFKYPGFEFVFGSHNVQLQYRADKSNTFYKKNVYAEIANRYNLREILKPGEVIYGEIYGDGIQKNYKYGLENDIDLVVFDLMVDGFYTSFNYVRQEMGIRNIPTVPLLFSGIKKDCNFDDFIYGNSELCPTQKVREGIVVRPVIESKGHMGRKIFKYISPDYLAQKGNSDWH